MAEVCRITAACEYPAYPLVTAPMGGLEVNALVEITAPAHCGPRPVFELALLLDVSGSMSGDRLDRLKQAVLALLDHLDGRDVVHLITYAGHPTVVSAGSVVGQHRETLKRAVASLHASGSTNISDALERAAHCIQSHHGDLLRRIFLYSDGEPTSGLRDPAEFSALCRDLKASSGAEVSTFGIGEGIDASVLQAIAEVSGGRYEFVTQKRIVEITEKAFSGMDRLFATNAQLTITAPIGVRLISAAEESMATSQTSGADQGLRGITIGTLKYDSEKQYLMRFSVASGCSGGAVGIDLTYIPAVDREGQHPHKHSTTLDIRVLPPQEIFSAPRPRNAKVALAVAMKAAGDAFTNAAAAMRSGATDRGRSMISEALSELEQFKDSDTTGMAETQLRRGQRMLDRLRVQGAAGARRVELELGHQATMLQRCLSVDDFSSSDSDNHSAIGSPRSDTDDDDSPLGSPRSGSSSSCSTPRQSSIKQPRRLGSPVHQHQPKSKPQVATAENDPKKCDCM